MFTIIIQYNNQIIAQKELSPDEIKENFNHNLYIYIIQLFIKYFNLDISEYMIYEYTHIGDKFIIKIRPEDLQLIRNNRINTILE